MQISAPQRQQLMLQALQTLVDAVKAGGKLGAPGGVMYAALLDKLSLQQFESMMRVLVLKGYLRKEGDLYHYVRDIIPRH